MTFSSVRNSSWVRMAKGKVLSIGVREERIVKELFGTQEVITR